MRLACFKPPGFVSDCVSGLSALIQVDTGVGTGFCLMSVNKWPNHAHGLSKQKTNFGSYRNSVSYVSVVFLQCVRRFLAIFG